MKFIGSLVLAFLLAAPARPQEAPPTEAPPTEALLGEWERLYLDDDGDYRRFFPVMFAPETLRFEDDENGAALTLVVNDYERRMTYGHGEWIDGGVRFEATDDEWGKPFFVTVEFFPEDVDLAVWTFEEAGGGVVEEKVFARAEIIERFPIEWEEE